MGYIRHEAIIITSWDAKAVAFAVINAEALGLTTIGPSKPTVNGYVTATIVPDGSKEGWDDSDIGDQLRAKFREWLRLQRHSDGGSSLEWVQIAYGSDDGKAVITDDEWSTPPAPRLEKE